MKNLADAGVRQSVLDRLAGLRPDSGRRWGKMTPNQMLCHLDDSFRLALGERTASMATGFFQRTVMKWGALHVPIKWPKNVPTRPEVAQDAGGTPPSEFEGDRARLRDAIERFCSQAAFDGARHPLFGEMSRSDWMRWGYLHADHHLRQFGL